MKIKENELYQDITICLDDRTKIGEAEVEIKGKMLPRLIINADNERAIHTYQKNGYRLDKSTMYLMTRDGDGE